jgi:DNA-damage-inducible protein D
MKKNKKIAIFEGKKIRRIWDEEKELWYFSVVDIVGALTDSVNPNDYWFKMKIRVKSEDGIELSTICRQLKLESSDGKKYETDCANTEGVFRIIQSIPSPKAEPFKRWLAKVGYERVQEIENPELAMDRMKAIYEKKGYPKEWIDKRSRGIAVRHSLTDEWKNRGVKNNIEYAILTNEIMESAFDLKVDDYKKLKGLKRENLRDHMDDMELILTMLGEATTTRFTKNRNSKGFNPLKKDARDGGSVAGRTRKDIENQSGKKIVSENNFLQNRKRRKRIET